MKAVLTTSRRPHFSITFGAVPFVSLLVLASLVALLGGMATSVFFFGLLLVFALLLIASRYFSSTSSQRVARLRTK